MGHNIIGEAKHAVLVGNFNFIFPLISEWSKTHRLLFSESLSLSAWNSYK